MKKTILSLVASTFISGAAIAAPAPVTFTGHATTGAECSAQFDEIGGINVKELSERKQCLAVVHDIDTMFTHKTFWVRTGNTFTAFDVEEIGKMNRSERAEAIKTGVISSVVVEELKKQIEDLKDEHMMAIVELSKAHAEDIRAAAEVVTGLADDIAGLEASLMSVQTALTEARVSNEKLTVEIAEVTADRDEALKQRDRRQQQYYDEINAHNATKTRLEGELAVANATASDLQTRLTAAEQAVRQAAADLDAKDGEIYQLEQDLTAAMQDYSELLGLVNNTEYLTYTPGQVFSGGGITIRTAGSITIDSSAIVADAFSGKRVGSVHLPSLNDVAGIVGVSAPTDGEWSVDAIIGLFSRIDEYVLDADAAHSQLTLLAMSLNVDPHGFTTTKALVQAIDEAVAALNIAVTPDNIDDLIADGIAENGRTPRTTSAKALEKANEYLDDQGVSVNDQFANEEELFNYIKNAENADSVAAISEAIGIDLFDVNYGNRAASSEGVQSAVHANGTADVTFVTTTGVITVENVSFPDGKLANFSNGFVEGFERGFQKGYDAGYNDGYSDGFRDGYTKGFNDGVASVTQ